MAKKTQINGNIILEALTKFPKTPSLTLAKKIYNENKQAFLSLDSVRFLVRYYRGQMVIQMVRQALIAQKQPARDRMILGEYYNLVRNGGFGHMINPESFYL